MFIAFCVTIGAVVKTPKSILFPSVVKAVVCNNVETVKLISKYGMAQVMAQPVEEIEIEYALVRSYQRATREPSCYSGQCNAGGVQVHCRPEDNIDNLECRLSGSGTSHRVNSTEAFRGRIGNWIMYVTTEVQC